MPSLSVSTNGGLSTFRPRTATFSEVGKVICASKYSTIIYKDGKRAEKNFSYADLVALDFDGDLSIKDAEERLKEYRYIIAPTKSHQVEKHGVIADRFRVVLELSERVNSLQDYKQTMIDLLSKFPEADPACKDGARYFEPSKKVHRYRFKGKTVIPSKYVEPASEAVVKSQDRGELSRLTYEFITFGAPDGQWNHRLLKATIDLQEQGYTIQEAKEVLKKPTGHLDENDLKTIDAQFAREVRYEKRRSQGFNLHPLGEIIKNKPKMDWQVDGLLSKGGVSILAGQPKSGKSTLARQLAVATINKTKFLGRQCKEGRVLYLAFEEQEELLYSQFKKLGVSAKEDRIMIHVGRVRFREPYEALKQAIESVGASLTVVDTFLLLDKFDVNSYNEVNDAGEKLRNVSRQTGCHIMSLHHQNKNISGGVESMMGSNAFHGAVDNAMMVGRPYQAAPNERIINSSQRGGKPFHGQLIEFDPVTESYELANKGGF